MKKIYRPQYLPYIRYIQKTISIYASDADIYSTVTGNKSSAARSFRPRLTLLKFATFRRITICNRRINFFLWIRYFLIRYLKRIGYGEPAISLYSHHVSLDLWTIRLLPVTKDSGSKPLGGLTRSRDSPVSVVSLQGPIYSNFIFLWTWKTAGPLYRSWALYRLNNKVTFPTGLRV
jgi:hypothetical protein